MVQYSSRNCKEKEQADKLEAALVKLKTFIVDEATRTGLKIASLFVQEHNEVGNRALDSTPVQLVHGDAVFHEKLLGLSFRISPTAFFQVNTKAAEVLNCLIRDWAGADKDGIVLDTCIPLPGWWVVQPCRALSDSVFFPPCTGARKVVGIEMCEAAVQDAKLNASSNNVSNCDFLAGKAEDQITKVIAEYVTPGTFTHCVAVLDPPREGVHNKVLKALREAPAIERIVYVSCNHVAWVEQAKMLCSPSTKIGGEPFTPVRANGVDLFPHTPHVELICLFERGACLAKSRPPKPEPETAAPAATKPEADAPSAVKAEEASAVA
ncbi:hypothetical protein T484DRAFT_1609871 [Baffinella frigidus]|nr:hypothetical protein T484DRAFT_1609871 [Cryptophyta sp. CCMP2293]